MKKILILCNNAPGFDFTYKEIIESLTNCNNLKVILAIEEPCFADKIVGDVLKYYLADHNLEQKYSNNVSNGYLSTIFNVELDRYSVYRLSSKEIEQRLYNYHSFFQGIFLEHKIDAVVWEICSNAFSQFAYNSMNEDCKFIGLVDSRINGYFEIWPNTNFEHFDYLLEDHGQAKLSLDCLNKPPSYTINLKKSNVIFYIKRLLFDLLQFSNNFGFYSSRFKLKLNRFLLRCRNSYARFYCNTLLYTPNFSEKFFLYALSVRPECSATIYGSEIYSDVEIIRIISNNLPGNSLLYIKIHPQDISFSINFFNEISRIPFVRIINSTYSNSELIKSSLGVITLSGTIGFESIILNKPVVLLGKANYSFSKLCFKVKNLIDLGRTLNEIYNNNNYDNNLSEFLNIYSRYTFNGSLDLNNLGFRTKNSVETCCKVIKSILKVG